MSQYDTSWGQCIGFGVDNTSVNVGLHKSIMTPVKALVISWDVLVILCIILLARVPMPLPKYLALMLKIYALMHFIG